MRILKVILFYIKWIIYFRITIWEREKYDMAKFKGMRCEEIQHGYNLFYTDYIYNPNRAPQERNFLIFREYKKTFYPYKEQK